MKRFFLCLTALFLAVPGLSAQSSPATVATSTDSTDLQQFQKVEDAWSLAINHRDQYGLETALSPLFVDIASDGEVTTRNQQIAQLLRAEDKTLHIDLKVITVRMLGDLAVVNGSYALHHRQGSAEVEEKGVYTHLFQRLHGNWICLNAQRTALRDEIDPKSGKSAKSPKKQSTAEMPFHIPLINK